MVHKKGHKKPRVEKEGEILGFEHQSKGCLGKWMGMQIKVTNILEKKEEINNI